MSHEANQNNAFENDDICEESCLKDSPVVVKPMELRCLIWTYQI